jgi:4-hydroxybenzoate polyprenyltransferase
LLKRIAILDVVTLAGLYCLRVITGGSATEIALSFWLLFFVWFKFLSLSLSKRYSEIVNTISDKEISGRGYSQSDGQVVQSLGTSSSIAAILIFALYINSPSAIDYYNFQEGLILSVSALTIWLFYLWLAASRGEIRKDPVLWALKSGYSQLLFLVFLAGFMVSRLTNL